MGDSISSKSLRRLIGVVAGLLAGGAVVMALLSGSTTGINLSIYDVMMRARPKIQPDSRIVLVTLDEESRVILGKKISQFTRSYFASAIENLMDDGAYVVFLDFDLSKPTYGDPGQDENLRVALEESGYVVLAKFVSGDGISVFPLPSYQDAALDLAMINLYQDPDGVVRRAPALELVSRPDGDFDDYLNAGLNLAWWMRAPEATGIPYEEIERPAPEYLTDALGEATAVVIDPLVVPVHGQQGFMLINYTGAAGTYPRVPFGKVVRGSFEPGTFTNKIVLIGNTHPTGHDFYSTPMVGHIESDTHSGIEIATMSANVMPGVEVHANMLDTVLHDRYIGEAHSFTVLWITLLVGVFGFLLFWMISLGTVATLVIYGGGVALLLGIPVYLFFNRSWFMPVFDPLLMLSVQFVGGTVFQRIVQGLEKAQITQTFGRYVSPQVVQEILDDPSVAQLGGEKREMTVLFTDIRGFTTISESMDPADLVNFLNRYLTRMTDIIFADEGVVDKYMGDAIMAFWGAPISLPNHHELACKSALDMMESLREFRDLKENQGLPVIDIGIGVNTGVMTVGNMGSDMRFDYTVMGDSVNLGSRLEGINKQYKTNIIVSESTAKKVKDKFVLRELDQVRVKGKNEPVRIFELLDFASQRSNYSTLLESFGVALALYRQQRWDAALEAFGSTLQIRPGDGPSEIYMERIELLRDVELSADWDGVFTMKTK